MKTKKNLKPLISSIGLIVIMMMTAASVCAEEPIGRDNQLPDQQATTCNTDDDQSGVEPMLIAPGETAENITGELPDYENYTGDMLISPGPKANSDTMTLFNLPILGIIGAVIVIMLVIVGIIMKRKKK